jgi:hypothetical protein
LIMDLINQGRAGLELVEHAGSRRLLRAHLAVLKSEFNKI